MRRREASIDDVAIEETERRIFGPRSETESAGELPLR
jgi:nuclear transport factor 2 (NTF2) superfamily protein